MYLISDTNQLLNVEFTIAPPALQSCLRCRRVVTRREQHDALEERVLETIRAEHPEWSGMKAGDPCLEQYRTVLRMRKKRSALSRAERLHARVRRYRWRATLRALARKCWRGAENR